MDSEAIFRARHSLFLLNLWEKGLVEFAKENKAVIRDLPDRVILSDRGLRKAMIRLDDGKRQQIEAQYLQLRTLTGAGIVARFEPLGWRIILFKPIEWERTER